MVYTDLTHNHYSSSIRPNITDSEQSEFNAYYYPRQSVTDSGKDYDGTINPQVMPARDMGSRAVRDMNRQGIGYYATRLNMDTRTFSIRAFSGTVAYAVPVAAPYLHSPEHANSQPMNLDVRTVARMIYAFQNFLNSKGFALRVDSTRAGTMYRCEPVALFAHESDALAYAVAIRAGYVYRADGSRIGTGILSDDE